MNRKSDLPDDSSAAQGTAGHDRAEDDHDHSHGPAIEDSTDKKRAIIAAGLTLLFMAIEVVGGIVSGSLALLADAGHMTIDAAALAFAAYAFHVADRPAGPVMTYGLPRLKALAAYTNGVTVFLIAFWIVLEAWHRLSEPGDILGGTMLAIAVAGLVVNLVVFAILHGGSRESLNMRGAILHVLGDLLGSVAAIAAAGIILLTGWTPIDPILSVLVALILLRTAWKLIHESGRMLMQGAPSDLNVDSVAADLRDNVGGVVAVQHVHVWALDENRRVATLHAELEDGAERSQAVRALRERLHHRHGNQPRHDRDRRR